MTCRTTIHYRGRVQGVGFRATTRMIAEGFAVTGYVRNLPDGRVELVAQGESREVAAFLDAVQDRLGRYIHDYVREDTQAMQASFNDFTIRY